MQKIKDFGEWLLNYIPREPKVVDKVLESFKIENTKMYEKRDTLFQPTQSKSALKTFAIQYRMVTTQKQPITNLMINTRQTKAKLIPSCMMEKIDLKSGEVIAREAAFHSTTDVNLEIANSNELFSKMKKLFWRL